MDEMDDLDNIDWTIGSGDPDDIQPEDDLPTVLEKLNKTMSKPPLFKTVISKEVQKLIDEGKLIPGFFMRSDRSFCIDAMGYLPAKDTNIASDQGYGKYNGTADVYFIVDFELTAPPNIATRISALLYDKQKKLMDRLIRKAQEYKVENHGEISLAESTINTIGRISFRTLEIIMKARSEGMYDGLTLDTEEPPTYKKSHPIFEPFANLDNEELLLECIPGMLYAEKEELLNLDRYDTEYTISAREKFNKLKKELNLSAEEVLKPMSLYSDRCSSCSNYPIGGFEFCTRECH